MQQTIVPTNNPATAAPAPLILTAQASQGLALKDGNYSGVIDHLEARPVTFADGTTGTYVDFIVNVDGQDGALKVGYSAKVTPRSDLGGLLAIFGVSPTPGVQVNLNSIFVGKRVAFIVFNETNDDGTFSRIKKGSLRPTA